jgi:hypothetical protein
VSGDPTTVSGPRRIGRYLIEAEVGRGGMGTVFRAHDPNLDRVVALKLPHGQSANKERFQREARAAARVLHPNVCPIFDVGEHDGEPFVVMAFIEGKSLSTYLDGAALSVMDAVRVAGEVLGALSAVHAAGIVHRDVKPGNVLIDAAGRVFLTDFGLALPEGGSHLTTDGVIVGTPAYMAPEQAGGRPGEVGPRTDVYAVGVLLYRMLTGGEPFQGSPAEVVAAVLRDEPPSPRSLRPDVDLALEAIVIRALAKRPDDRFPDARSFAEALTAYAATFRPKPADTTVVLPAPVGDAPKPQPAWGRRAGWAIGFAAAAAIGWLQAYWTHHLAGATFFGPGNYALFMALIAVPVGILSLVPVFWWYLVEWGRWPAGVRRAAKVGAANVIRAAVANGVPLDEPDEFGDTALMIAAARGHEEAVKALLLGGARADRVNSFGQTAAQVAYANGRSAIFDVFQRAAQSPGAPRRAIPAGAPPRVGAILLGALLTGTLLYVLWAGLNGAWRTRIDFDAAMKLVREKQTRFAAFVGASPPVRADGTTRVPDIHGQVSEPRRHPQLWAGRFIASPPEGFNDTPAQRQALGLNASVAGIEYAWPTPSWGWWPVLAIGQAALYAGLLWLAGIGRLFGLLPRRGQ